MKNPLRLLILPILLTLVSCGDDGGPVKPGNGPGSEISFGPPVEVGTLQVAASGGTVAVSKPGDPLDGFEITVPAGGFDASSQFTVSAAEITSHDLDGGFSPVSPMIRIVSDGAYCRAPMTVKVPVRVPDGHFAMGFFYDEPTGTLEPIPVDDIDSASVTLSTRHLSPSAGLIRRGLFRGSTSAIANLVIVSILTSALENQAAISSGFEPGRDDWEFPNFGSYAAPGGHCAGQAMTAMWYYYEKRLAGEPALNHRYDTVNDPADGEKHWYDNPRGYRFASTLQEDQNFDRWIENLEFQTARPRLSWYCFITAMLLTGEPQFMLIRESATGAGHAMIVYKITPSAGTLHIADPNYPNNKTRVIEYRNGALLPYSSALVAGGPGTVFDQIGYAAKTTHIEWPKISERWDEFQNGTIGNGLFPAYTLWARNPPGAELVDTLTTYADTLKVHCRSVEPPRWLADTDHYQVFRAYDENGTALGKGGSANKGILSIPLDLGENKIGFLIEGFTAATTTDFVDFRWVKVKRLRSDIDFSRVKEVGGGIMGMETRWLNHRGEEETYHSSPVWSAKVTMNGNVLSGVNSITGDSVSVICSPGSVTYYVKTEDNLGGQWVDFVATGTVSSKPLIRDNGFRFEASGQEGVAGVVTSISYQPGSSWTWLGYSFEPSATFGLSFYY